MDDMVKLVQLYGDKDNGFSSRLLDSIMHRLHRERWAEYPDGAEEGVIMAAE